RAHPAHGESRAMTAPRPSGPGASRRAFVAASAAAFATIALAPGVHLITLATARPSSEPASKKVRWGLLIDTTRCQKDCRDCVAACAAENGLKPASRASTASQWIRIVEVTDPKSGRTQSVPMMCQHCAHPPCVDVCPTGASFKRADGIVLVDRHTCIGCRYCMMACPYKARSFVHEELTDQRPLVPRGKGCVEGCTLCVHRIDRDREPACVEACRTAGHDAMLFGDLNDANSAIAKRVAQFATSQVRADLKLDPGVRYMGI
ncbi:MAG TPA: 4Fe-4S dicluster domain-containing protein, partial [Burkholderiales bacterium]|nr:4Fe-4S dicluster domain-containing protein [Burkholderiales bacterium]